MLTIKILGSGCPNCKKLEMETRKAVGSLAVDAEFIKVSNPREIMEYDILRTPGLVINEKVVSSGSIPSQEEIITFLADALQAG